MAGAVASLDQPITGGARRTVNFFNGRLLTGEDLSREQAATRAAELRLGEAIGAGVATGLEVALATGLSTPAQPVVTVEAGIALASGGRLLELPCRTDVALAAPPELGGSDGLLFSDCAPRTPGTYVAGSGVFVLLIGPASAAEGRAPVSGLGGEAGCNVAFRVDAVQLRLVRLALGAADLGGDPQRLRARVTDLLFGIGDPARPSPAVEPFGPRSRRWGMLDALRQSCVSDEEVPIAVLHWTAAAGVRWLAPWAARRGPARPDAPPGWPSVLGARRRAEAEAYLHAFGDHLDDLRLGAGDPLLVRARSVFDHLPPAGLVPLASAARPRAFDEQRFFEGLTVRGPVHLEGRRAAAVLHESLRHDPIDIRHDPPECIWLYVTRESVDDTHGRTRAGQPYLVFASGHLPYAAAAQFDLSYWDFANTSIRLA